MTGLVLKLRPAERILINGIVIENGDRRARLNILTSDASILRLRDALHPSDVSTPVTRVCYLAQLMLAGETDPVSGQKDLRTGIRQLEQVFQDGSSSALCREAATHAAEGRIYQSMKALRSLCEVEREMMKAHSV